MYPVLKLNFSGFLKRNSETAGAISMNLTANILGLGNAATPLGIKAMKLMNEVESEYDGTVAAILVENGEMVEYGQPLMVIQ